MTTADGRKRKRPVTSCGECYRRKQKCNREFPCSLCIGRGVPERCSFGIADGQINFGTHNARKHKPIPPESRSEVDEHSNPISDPANLGDQLGYSQFDSSNFAMLQKFLLRSDKETSATVEPSHDTPVPHFILAQVAEIQALLPSDQIQSKLVDVYFNRSWWWFTSLEPRSFRQQLDQWYQYRTDESDGNVSLRPREMLYFPALLFQVLAVSLQYLPIDATDIWKELHLYDAKSNDTVSAKYSAAGTQIMELLGRQNSAVTAVQHDMVKGNWFKNVSRGTESWYSLGNAIRQAQEIGLNLDRSPPDSLDRVSLNRWLWQDVLNKRVWACLLGWDAHVAFTLGRSRILNVNDCARMQLSACEIPADMSAKPPPLEPEELSSSPIVPVLFQYSMGYIIHEMLDLKAVKPDSQDHTVVESLDHRIRTLMKDISPFFRHVDPDTSMDRGHSRIPKMRLHLASVANTYLVALHRAHALRRSDNCDTAISAALTVLRAQDELFQSIEQQNWRIYTYSFFTIDAAIFLSALLLERPATLSKGWLDSIIEQLRRALERVEQMKASSPIASTGAQILRRCYGRITHDHATTGFERANKDLVLDEKVNGGTDGITDDLALFSSRDLQESSHDTVTSPLRTWIEQMDQVMLPILEADPNGPFDHALWCMLLEP